MTIALDYKKGNKAENMKLEPFFCVFFFFGRIFLDFFFQIDGKLK